MRKFDRHLSDKLYDALAKAAEQGETGEAYVDTLECVLDILDQMQTPEQAAEDIELLKMNWGIAIDCLKLAKHGAPDIGRLNDALIEMRKRLVAAGVDMETLEK